MRPGIPALVLLLVCGCGTDYTRSMAPVRSGLRLGSAETALERLPGSFPDSTGGDRLLYLMERGNLLRLSGRTAEAIPVLLEADRLSDLLRGTDAGEEIASLLSSDLARDFRGADYENVFINYCLAMCYIAEGETGEALVECRRVAWKLSTFNDRYAHRNRYGDDAFVRYVSGVIFEIAGDPENALVAYRNSLRVYETDYSANYSLGPPDRLKADILRLSAGLPGFDDLHAGFAEQWPGVSWEGQGPGDDRGEVVVVIEQSLIPPRTTSSMTGHSEDRIVRIAVPSIRDYRRQVSTVTISSGSSRAAGFLAEDLSSIAVKNLEDHAARDLARAVARALVKAGAAEAAEQLTEELTGEEDGCWSQGAGILVSILGAATEEADLRAWLTLPSRIYVARLALPPGERLVRVEVDGLVAMQAFVQVRAGTTELMFARTP